MGELIEIKREQERVVLVAVEYSVNEDSEAYLDELSELAKTAGAETVGRLVQKRETVSSSTYIGKGKVEELKNCLTVRKYVRWKRII